MALDQLDAFMHSLGALESGNNYDAVGPNTGSTYGRARGRWQIMEKIYPAWAREAGVSPNDYSPAAQERVARYKMTQYYNKYGSWDLVAVAWFAGPGRADKAAKSGVASVGGIKDMLGTSVSGYVAKVKSGMGSASGGTERNQERGLGRQPGNPSGGGAGLAAGWDQLTETVGRAGQGTALDSGGGTERTVERGLLRQGAQTARSGQPNSRLGTRTVGPMETAPGVEMTAVQRQTREDQMNQDTLGSIMDTISQAARQAGGGLLDARSLFGMPTRPVEPQSVGEPVVANLAPEPSEPTPQSDGPMAPPPKHDGFAPLEDHAKAGAQKLMAQFPGLTFTSGYRDPARNKAAGGVATSKHMTGEATDFDGDEKTMQAAAAWAKANGAKKAFVHEDGDGDGVHLHIEW